MTQGEHKTKSETLPLTGKVIALPETREIDLFASLLERRGAQTLRCPLVAIHDVPDAAPIEQWLKRCINDEFDDVILLTGEGLRRLLGFAERADLKADFIDALARVRKITRGPKPARALRDIGLKTDMSASEPTTAGILRDLNRESLKDRRIAVQLYGQDPNYALTQFLADKGAVVSTVAPYIYADESQTQRVREFIHALLEGQADAIAFTSSPQVKRLIDVARRDKNEVQLLDALDDIVVAAVGPLVADALQRRGINVDLSPKDSYFLKPLVSELVAKFNP